MSIDDPYDYFNRATWSRLVFNRLTYPLNRHGNCQKCKQEFIQRILNSFGPNDMSVSNATLPSQSQSIQTWIEHMKMLGQRQLSWREYVTEVLQLLVNATEAQGGVFWEVDNNQSKIIASIDTPESFSDQESRFFNNQKRIVIEATNRNEPSVLTQRGVHESDKPENHSGHPGTIFALPTYDEITNSAKETYVVQLFFSNKLSVNAQTTAFQTALRLLSFFKQELARRSITAMQAKVELAGRLHRFQTTISKSLEVKHSAYTIANEVKTFLAVDRVSVAVIKGRSVTISAISGQDTFDQRSPAVRRIKQLCRQVARTGSSIQFDGDIESMPNQLRQVVEQFVDQNQSRTFVAVPLFETKRELTSEEQSHQDRSSRNRVIGVLVIEQFRDRVDEIKFNSRLAAIVPSISAAFSNAVTHNRLFLMPLWRNLGKVPRLFQGRTLPKTLIGLGVLLVITIVMIAVPADLKVKANGVIQPVQRQDVFARVGGRISKVNVSTGDFVKRGQVLLELENKDLAKQITEAEGKLREAVEKHANVKNHRLREHDNVKRSELAREQAIWETRIVGYDTELEILFEKRAHLMVLAPFDGQVVTWNLEQLLEDRPVQIGQVLITVAKEDGPWELELNMPEKRMGHINRWITESDEHDPQVSFVLSSDPRTVRYGRVKEIQPVALLDGTDGHTVKILVDFDVDQPNAPFVNLRPGTTVVGHVHCGRTSFGYAKLNEAFQWMQRQYFAWF